MVYFIWNTVLSNKKEFLRSNTVNGESRAEKMHLSTKGIILRSKERLYRYTSAAVLEKKGKAVALGNIVQTSADYPRIDRFKNKRCERTNR